MESLKFNRNGLLEPSEGIYTDIDAFYRVFVASFPDSQTRKGLFENYPGYNRLFQREIFFHCEQWIDGSFTTQIPNPVFPENHVFHKVTQNYKDQWFNRFTKTKPNENDQIFPKGFLKIKFDQPL